MGNQFGRVFLITGGAAGCGFETAKQLYHLNGTVYIAGRSLHNAEAAIQSILSSPVPIEQTVPSGQGTLRFLNLDLSDLSTIKASAKEFLAKEKRLDVIFHNAGTLGDQKEKTKQGYEIQLATNALGPWLFQHFLTPLCLKTAILPGVAKNATRIIWVSSDGHKGSPKPDGVNWDDMNLDKFPGIKGEILRYGQSKAMNCIFAHELARRYSSQGLISLSLHPGSVKTGLFRNIPKWFAAIIGLLLYPQSFGGLTELFAGLTEILEEDERNGGYVLPWGRWGEGATHVFEGLRTRRTGERLWQVMEKELEEWMM